MDGVSDVLGQGRRLLPTSGKVQGSGEGFNETLNNYLKDVNSLLQDAGEKAEGLVAGEVEDIHDVMIAGQKASIALEMVVEIRNKLLESYREFMRMQI